MTYLGVTLLRRQLDDANETIAALTHEVEQLRAQLDDAQRANLDDDDDMPTTFAVAPFTPPARGAS